jgi:hypothetical protein
VSVRERSRAQNLDPAPARYLPEILVTRNDHAGTTGHRAGKELVVVRIVADPLRQVRCLHDLGVHGHQRKDGLKLQAIVLHRKEPPHPPVFVQDGDGDQQRQGTVSPRFENPARNAAEEDS